MKKIILRLTLIIVVFAVVSTSCKKDDFEPNTQIDNTTTSIKTSIPRIVDNGNGGINVFVNVTDQNGQAIKGLTEENFLFEVVSPNGQTQTMTPSGPGQLPNLIITALAMDYSGSMYADSVSIPGMENAISTFITLKNSYDQIELIKFSDNVQVTVPLTSNQSLLLAGLNDTSFVGMNSTALYAALQTGIDDVIALAINNPTYLPSVVGFTDGKNNQPPYSADTLIVNSIIEQVPIYSIGYGVSPDTTQLKYISGQTGGQFFWSPSASYINTVYQHINGQLVNTTIIPLPGPQTKGKIKIRCTTTYECAAGVLKSTAEKDYHY